MERDRIPEALNMRLKDKLQGPWAILGCAWVLAFAMFARILCLPPIGHIIKEELLLSHSQVGLIFSLPLGILAAISVPSGLLTDRIGIRKVGRIGTVIMAAGSFLTGSATTFMTLLVPTALFGVGFSLLYPSLPKLVSVWFSKEKAGVATGIYVTGISIGAALALTITLPVVFLMSNSFRGAFYIWSLPVIAAAILWWIVVKDPPAARGGPKIEQAGGKGKVGTSHTVWKNTDLWLVVLAFFCNVFVFYTWVGWSPKLMMLKGASPTLAALMTSVIQWVAIPIVFVVPWISYKVGLRKPFIWASALVLALAAWGAIYIPLSLGWLLMITVGIAANGIFPMMLSLPIELVPKESVGTASGLMLSLGYTGGLVGPFLAGYIMDTTGTLDLALAILVGVGIGWTLIAFLLPETGSRAGRKSAFGSY